MLWNQTCYRGFGAAAAFVLAVSLGLGGAVCILLSNYGALMHSRRACAHMVTVFCVFICTRLWLDGRSRDGFEGFEKQ